MTSPKKPHQKKTVVIGILGTTLDAGKGARRWERWRPTVSLCQHDDLLIDRLDLLHDKRSNSLANAIIEDIASVSPETKVVEHDVEMLDPWDFEEVYGLLHDFATRYAAAWSSGDPQLLASFYAERGELTVNGGAPSVGRAAIAATARAYMEAFPDMHVALRELESEDGRVRFHWNWTGTNTGPGGTGRAVRLSGHEEWTFSPGGRIAVSRGCFDEAEYARQLAGER